jgi:hypothetical protein
MNYGTNGAGCMYMGSMTPTAASSPCGYPLGGDANYGGFVGDLDKDRKNPYPVNDGNSCGYAIGVRGPLDVCYGTGPVDKSSNHCLGDVPFQNYHKL